MQSVGIVTCSDLERSRQAVLFVVTWMCCFAFMMALASLMGVWPAQVLSPDSATHWLQQPQQHQEPQWSAALLRHHQWVSQRFSLSFFFLFSLSYFFFLFSLSYFFLFSLSSSSSSSSSSPSLTSSSSSPSPTSWRRRRWWCVCGGVFECVCVCVWKGG